MPSKSTPASPSDSESDTSASESPKDLQSADESADEAEAPKAERRAAAELFVQQTLVRHQEAVVAELVAYRFEGISTSGVDRRTIDKHNHKLYRYKIGALVASRRRERARRAGAPSSPARDPPPSPRSPAGSPPGSPLPSDELTVDGLVKKGVPLGEACKRVAEALE
tara:strand:+ start:32 stop:532 length:501 start_codon:yes stop_codon:yes gene_type:complete